MTSFVISSFELPASPEALIGLRGAATVHTGLGPTIGPAVLEQAVDSLRAGQSLHLLGLLRGPAWEILSRAVPTSGLYQSLRAIACGFTELMLSERQIRRLAADPAGCDRVMACYIGNLMADFARFASTDGASRIHGSYWSLEKDRLVACSLRERQLTPAFGQLLLEFSQKVVS